MREHAIPRAPTQQAELSDRLQPTPRELDVLRCAARGLDNKGTSRELFLAPQTIKFHKTNLYSKLGARSIGHAIAIGYQRGLLFFEGDVQHVPVVEVDGVLYEPAKDQSEARKSTVEPK